MAWHRLVEDNMNDLEARLHAAKDNAVLQAQIWAQEARNQRATVLEILRYFGLPERDWEALRLKAKLEDETPAGVALPVPAGRALPNPGSPEASAMLDSMLAEYNWPANSKNAARAGWEAANRWLTTAGVEPSAEGQPLNGIAATVYHDEGAYAQCGSCGRYTLDPMALSARPRACECGEKLGWCGSFKRPGPDAKWSNHFPAAGVPVSPNDQQEQPR
jgi:hypothetical protein